VSRWDIQNGLLLGAGPQTARRRRRSDPSCRTSEAPVLSTVPPEIQCQQLCSVTDAERGERPSSKNARIDMGGAFCIKPTQARPLRIRRMGVARTHPEPRSRCVRPAPSTHGNSRTRRAISCAYCPPRSTTSNGPLFPRGRSDNGRTSAAIVRCLLRDRHVVRMAPHANPAAVMAHELGALHLLDRRGAAITHRLGAIHPTNWCRIAVTGPL